MTTLTTNVPNPTSTLTGPQPVGWVDTDHIVELREIGWAGYKAVSRLRRGRSRPKLIYIDGDLTLVSPGQPHERLNVQIGTFLYEVLTTLRVHFFRLGQTTWRRRRENAGVEGDQIFYITNEHLVRGRTVDLRVDPPPDLAIEVVYSNKATRALEVYGRLGVPEVWVCDENRVAILLRQEDGEYQEADRSLCLPFLTAAEIVVQIQQPDGMAELDWIDGVRRWVREVLVPRVPAT